MAVEDLRERGNVEGKRNDTYAIIFNLRDVDDLLHRPVIDGVVSNRRHCRKKNRISRYQLWPGSAVRVIVVMVKEPIVENLVEKVIFWISTETSLPTTEKKWESPRYWKILERAGLNYPPYHMYVRFLQTCRVIYCQSFFRQVTFWESHRRGWERRVGACMQKSKRGGSIVDGGGRREWKKGSRNSRGESMRRPSSDLVCILLFILLLLNTDTAICNKSPLVKV